MIEKKVIIITGAASGMGAAAARIFAEDGASLILADWSTTGQAVADDLAASGHAVRFVRADVSQEADVIQMVQAAIDSYGHLDGAFNNAGVEMSSKLLPDLSVDEFDRVVSVDLRGVFLCMKYEILAMKGRGGAIVNTASGYSVIGGPYAADYVAAKHGVLGLTRAASTETRDTGVRVNCVIPGLTLTPMIKERLFSDPSFAAQIEPMKERHSIGRFGEPEDIARAAKWLLCDESAYVNGAALAVDGGYVAR
ncbi:MAG: hypothetical protein JWO15_2239 [Sphingomonadales bacterium]|nr:hypothetical protein [Sphingomonadales bacterium]